MSAASAVLKATEKANAALEPLRFGPPVACVYNPLVYAHRSHRRYVERFAGGAPKRALFLGMNPGPFGMVQTGVPFGEVALVREWIGIEESVDKPDQEHPKRAITGFETTRSEVSGKRLWGWCKARFGTADRFFAQHYVHNFCPLAFMEESGRNLTPDKLPAEPRRALFDICDDYLRDVVRALRPAMIVGVGAFAEDRARRALKGVDDLEFGRLPHPSPASPAANRGWDALADRAFEELGLLDEASG